MPTGETINHFETIAYRVIAIDVATKKQIPNAVITNVIWTPSNNTVAEMTIDPLDPTKAHFLPLNDGVLDIKVDCEITV